MRLEGTLMLSSAVLQDHASVAPWMGVIAEFLEMRLGTVTQLPGSWYDVAAFGYWRAQFRGTAFWAPTQATSPEPFVRSEVEQLRRALSASVGGARSTNN
jgi:hypothetical protein